jgi:uncharacterized protein YecE (DUF72 family)
LKLYAFYATNARFPRRFGQRPDESMSSNLGGLRIGVAGWSIPRALRPAEASGKSLLEQYARVFKAVEINTSFYRPHRFVTYQRWASSVPDDFRFAVKLPRLMTHERRLRDCQGDIDAFMACVRGLGDKLGVLLVQLPPSALFDAAVARGFFKSVRKLTAVPVVCEARNPGWFTPQADELLQDCGVMRVLADPTPAGCEVACVSATNFSYWRLHGSPKIYYSAYSTEYLQHIRALTAGSGEFWCIFDNTAAGAAWPNAQELQRLA